MTGLIYWNRWPAKIRNPNNAEIMTSIAISLKRIADALSSCDQYGATGSESISYAIRDGIREGRP